MRAQIRRIAVPVALVLALLVTLPALPVQADDGSANATYRGAVAGNATDAAVAHGAAQAPAGSGAGIAREGAPAGHGTLGIPSSEAARPSSGWGSYFQAIGILLLILGALYMGLWAMKRYGKLRGLGGKLGRQGLAVEGQFHLGPKKTLVVVRFLNKRLLLGVTDHQINLITEMEADDDATHTSDTSADFSSVLDEAGNTDSPS